MSINNNNCDVNGLSLKIGDRVKVIDAPKHVPMNSNNSISHGMDWVTEMDQFRGKTFTVTCIYPDCGCTMLNDLSWVFSSRWLSKVDGEVPANNVKSPHKCNCAWNDVLRYGCKCGGI